MTLDDFQEKSRELASKGPGGVERFEWCSKGLIDSAGKISKLLVNCSFQGEPLLSEDATSQMSEHLGFILWYCSVLADALDKRLDGIASDHLQRMQEILKDQDKI